MDGPTTPIKKQTVKVDKKGDPIICCPQKTHFQYRHRQIKNKGIEKDIYSHLSYDKGDTAGQ